MTRPTLYIFTISHYCEKARWALDYLEFDADVQTLAPGSHIKVAKKLGLKRGSVPFLKAGDQLVQGSEAIIDWAEEQTTSGKTLGSSNKEVIDVELRLDKELGVHIRRWFYSEAILETPELVKPIFTHKLSAWEKLKLSIKWPAIQKIMTSRMDLGYDQGIESLEVVRQEMKWLEGLIDGKSPYLVGDSFTRADLAAASLLAPLVIPKEYSYSTLLRHPPRAKQARSTMMSGPVCQWVAEKYRHHRLC